MTIKPDVATITAITNPLIQKLHEQQVEIEQLRDEQYKLIAEIEFLKVKLESK